MSVYGYLFEAHSIQRYILDSGRLAGMVGASELIESLTADAGLLECALEKLELSQPPEFARRAGGAITAFFATRDDTHRFRDLWGLLIEHYAPALAYSHVVVEGENVASAVDKGKKALRVRKQYPKEAHPAASPVVRRSPRTGLPATDTGTDFDEDPGADAKEWVDRASHMKSAGRFRKAHDLLDKFGTPDGMQWPTLLEPDDNGNGGVQFPFLPDNRYVGIVHADGNNLGALIRRLEYAVKSKVPNDYPRLFHVFSDAIAVATCRAAATAADSLADAAGPMDTEGRRALPARPIVLGGDDLTIIVRGDLSLNYTEAFIKAFEVMTDGEFSSLKKQYPIFRDILPGYLTACAGIAFVRSTQPFYLAYDLAEGMCDHAKQASRNGAETMGSALVFGRVTTSFIHRYQDLRDQELRVTDGETTYHMTLGAYRLGRVENDLPQLENLRHFKELLARPEMARGASRKLLGLLHTSPSEAKRSYRRWKDNLADANRAKSTDRRLIEFRQCISNLGVDLAAELPYCDLDTLNPATPLGDVLAWLAVDGPMEANDDA